MTTNATTIDARLAPRDLIDVGLALFLVLPVGGVFFVLPTLFVYIASGDYSISFLSGVTFFLVLFFLIGLLSFASVTCDKHGLTLKRYLGSSVYIPWSELAPIKQASRTEVFLRVWLWPGLPPRGSIFCMSAADHYRIKWGSRKYYFSPKYTHNFDAIIEMSQTHEVSSRAETPKGSAEPGVDL